jgi:hypothetical protein
LMTEKLETRAMDSWSPTALPCVMYKLSLCGSVEAKRVESGWWRWINCANRSRRANYIGVGAYMLSAYKKLPICYQLN